MRKTTCALLTLSVFLSCFLTNGVCAIASDSERVSGYMDYEYAFTVIKLVNVERRQCGLNELAVDSDVLDAAMIRSAEIAVSFNHTRPNGKSSSSVVDWRNCFGENIAMGQKTPQEVVDDWMNSPSHRENILNPKFNNIGVGCFISNNRYYWAQSFTGSDVEADRIVTSFPAIPQFAECDVSLGSVVETVLYLPSRTLTVKNKIPRTTTVRVIPFPTANNYEPTPAPSPAPPVQKPATVIHKTSLTKLTAKDNGISVNWKKANGVSGYQVQYSSDSKFKNKKSVTVKGSAKTSKLIKGLKSHKKYYFRVRTYKTVNGNKQYSQWSSVKNKKTK